MLWILRNLYQKALFRRKKIKKACFVFFSSLKTIYQSLRVITKTFHTLLLKAKYFISFCPAVGLSNMLGISFHLRSRLDSN